VGSLVDYKNQQYILEVCKRLYEKKFCFHWYIVGDGPLRKSLENFVTENGLESCVTLTGKKSFSELRDLYRQSNFLVQATLIEGFGKAPVEALLHGVIPVLNNISMAEEMIGNGSRGYIFDAEHPENLEILVYSIMKEQHRFINMIENGRAYVKWQTLENWANNCVAAVNDFFEEK